VAPPSSLKKTAPALAAQTRFDIADAIIHLAGRRQGCETTVTFDRKFAKMKGVRMLA